MVLLTSLAFAGSLEMRFDRFVGASFSRSDHGLEVMRAPFDSGLLSGDQVVSVGGVAIRTRAGLRRSLGMGQQQVLVQRGGQLFLVDIEVYRPNLGREHSVEFVTPPALLRAQERLLLAHAEVSLGAEDDLCR